MRAYASGVSARLGASAVIGCALMGDLAQASPLASPQGETPESAVSPPPDAFVRGLEADARGQRALACALFLESLESGRAPELLLKVGRCASDRGALLEAQEWLREAQESALRAPESCVSCAGAAAQELDRLARLTPTLVVERPRAVGSQVLLVRLGPPEGDDGTGALGAGSLAAMPGEVQALSTFGRVLRVDPGWYVLETERSGLRSRGQPFRLAPGSQARMASPEPREQTSDGQAGSSLVNAPSAIAAAGHPTRPDQSLWHLLPPQQFFLAGVGAALVGTGGFLGYRAQQAEDEVRSGCATLRGCDPSLRSAEQRSRTLARAADVLFLLGGVSLASGLLLHLSTQDEDASPALGSLGDGWRLQAQGRF